MRLAVLIILPLLAACAGSTSRQFAATAHVCCVPGPVAVPGSCDEYATDSCAPVTVAQCCEYSVYGPCLRLVNGAC